MCCRASSILRSMVALLVMLGPAAAGLAIRGDVYHLA